MRSDGRGNIGKVERGLVVARHRRHVTVEAADGERCLCQAERRLHPLVGDDVEWRKDAAGTGTVTALLDRRSTLTRIDSRGRCELVAANVTQLIAVAAPAPAPDWFVVDHYLVAAELARLSAVVVMNKTDLREELPRHLDCYRRAGFPVHATSAAQGVGVDELSTAMRQERSVMVGQSGVGKSSLLNALLGGAVQSTGELTGKGAQGRHTTSSAVLHRLPNGGELIDSPGVRAYAPFIDDAAQLEHGFREFREHLGRCRFDNCRHLAEPGCAVKAALDAGRICRRRYESYERLYGLILSLKARR